MSYVSRFVLCVILVLCVNLLFSFGEEKSDFYTGLKIRSIGPAGMSGRIAAVDVALSNPRIIYVGAATGGLWKSTDGGVTWKAVFDDQNTSSIGDVSIAQDNPETVWVGTGEANPRNSVGVGRGVFKTLNGGQTWEFLGLEKTEKISRLLLDPTRPDTAFVAAMGTTWGENPERGIFKTQDGGKTWEKVLYVDDKTGAADLAMDPNNPNRLLAAMWEHRRWPWFFKSGGAGSGLYLSIDGGENWRRLTAKEGLPQGELGRIGIAFSRNRSNIVYALVEAQKSALCRSEDGGQTWKIVNAKSGVSPRPFYYADIRVHPLQENTVYRLASAMDVSIDGGQNFKSFIPFFAVHGDYHELWIHPDGKMMIAGGDGGIGISYDGGTSWNFVQNLPLAQYYHIAVDMDQPYNIYGGLQDNGSWRGPSRVLVGMSIFNFHWQCVGWGDGFGTLPLPHDSSLGYSMSQGGYLVRFNTRTGELKDIRPPAPEGVKLRFNWNAAIAIDPFETKTLYYGSQFMHKSQDEGHSWAIISPDLTTNDPEKQKQAESGGLTIDATNAENHCTIITISPSAKQQGVIWVGTDDGRIHVTQDGGAHWQDVSVSSVPDGTWIPHVEASAHEAGTAYVVFDDHRRANWTPYVFMTTNFGASWKNLASSDIDGFIHVLREDPVQKNLLFLGTEFGLFMSLDRGRTWKKWKHGFPTAPVRDMVIHPRDFDLVIGTHGRSVYVLDDIQPLQEWSETIAAKDIHLFSISDAHQYTTAFIGMGYLTPGNMEFLGENRTYGALITYSVGEKSIPTKDEKAAGEKIKIEILNAEGQVVRTLNGPKKAGLNRINWDLRHSAFKSLMDPFAGFFPPSGPFVLPGKYTAQIKHNETVLEQTFDVLPDPRTSVSDENRKQKYDLVMDNGKYIEAVTDAYKKMETSLKAVDEVLSRIDQFDEKYQEPIKTKAIAIKEKLSAFSKELAPPEGRSGIHVETELSSRLIYLGSRMESSFEAPTQGQRQEFAELQKETQTAIDSINAFFKEEYQGFLEELKQAGFSLFPKIEPIKIKD